VHLDLTSAREAKGECAAELALALVAAEEAGETSPAVAVGIGVSPDGGFVVAIRSESPAGPIGQVVSELVDGRSYEVDARVIGPVRKLETPPFRGRLRPLVPGASVSLEAGGTGTIATVVRRPGSDTLELLSNNHVLADENRAPDGAPVLQPGLVDGGMETVDRVAALTSFAPIDVEGVNEADCAVAAIDEGIEWSFATFEIYGGLTHVFELADDFPAVAKFGRTTGHTVGTVTAFELDNVRVQYDVGVVRFDGQIEVAGTEDASFSAPGDSGSLVVTAATDESGAAAVGLLFAGSQTGGPSGLGLTYVNPIVAVLAALEVELELEPEAG
jgi:hypothetical protein